MRWREIFTEITEDNGYYEYGKVNFYNIASLFEDLYVRIDELEEKRSLWAAAANAPISLIVIVTALIAAVWYVLLHIIVKLYRISRI